MVVIIKFPKLYRYYKGNVVCAVDSIVLGSVTRIQCIVCIDLDNPFSKPLLYPVFRWSEKIPNFIANKIGQINKFEEVSYPVENTGIFIIPDYSKMYLLDTINLLEAEIERRSSNGT